ncbi:MAG: ABC transporter substrate-binding protein, partial [Alphaproteobacteria bacterium]|nr:ABC transporter substrate-binding protein [Alphaproteobacteria bacterium]
MTTTNAQPSRPPRSSIRRQFLTGAAALALAAWTFRGLPAQADTEAMQTVRAFYDVLLGTMKEGPQLGVKGRFDRLAPAIDQNFDLAFMARTAVGPQWLKFSAPERDNVTKALRRYIVATYADNFDEYSGERLAVRGEDNFSLGRVVRTRVVKPDGVPVKIDYLMHDDGTSWRIRDVYLDGQIS